MKYSPLFNNITVALYTIIVAAYIVFIINQTPVSSFIEETGKGGSYFWFVFFIQLFSICLFMYGLVLALKGSMNPKKTGFIMIGFLILEGSKSFYYLTYGTWESAIFASFIILIYVLGVVCADLYFVKNIKITISICGVTGIACFGIYREIQSVYQLLMTADHLYSWMNSLMAFLMIIINLLFIYQALVLNNKRKQAIEKSFN